MDHDKACQDVLALDSKIRFVGVVNIEGVLIKSMYQKGVDEFLSESELKMSLH